MSQKLVIIYATDKAAYMKAGRAYQVDSNVADKLVKQGKASFDKPKDKKAKEGK
jgi:hypothetical protein